MSLHGHCVLALLIKTEPQIESSPTHTIPSVFIPISPSAQKDTPTPFFPIPSHFQGQFIQYLLSAHFTPRNTSLTMALDLLYLNRTPGTNHPKPLAIELTQYMPTSGSYNYYVCIL